MTVGFRIKQSWTRVSPELVEKFHNLPVANVSDCMSRLTAGGVSLQRMHRTGYLAGPALTVKVPPGDNLMLHHAIDIAQHGDVIVVDGGAVVTNALMGELMMRSAIAKGVAGFVINGAIRDADDFLEINHPIFALGTTHRGPYKNGPGEIGFPVAIDGMVIHPGDLIIGDGDGVLCVPTADVESILLGAQKKHTAEAQQRATNIAGTTDRSWVKEALLKGHCDFL